MSYLKVFYGFILLEATVMIFWLAQNFFNEIEVFLRLFPVFYSPHIFVELNFWLISASNFFISSKCKLELLQR